MKKRAWNFAKMYLTRYARLIFIFIHSDIYPVKKKYAWNTDGKKRKFYIEAKIYTPFGATTVKHECENIKNRKCNKNLGKYET